MLKRHFEIDKANWDQRLQDEKQKSERKLIAITEELEQKFVEERQVLEDENEELRVKIFEMEK